MHNETNYRTQLHSLTPQNVFNRSSPETKTLPQNRIQQHQESNPRQRAAAQGSPLSLRKHLDDSPLPPPRHTPTSRAAHENNTRHSYHRNVAHFENRSFILEGRGLSLTVSLQWSASGSSFQPGHVCDVGVPTVSKIRLSWSDSFLPGKAEDLVNSSATMQPTDHRSTAGPYCRDFARPMCHIHIGRKGDAGRARGGGGAGGTKARGVRIRRETPLQDSSKTFDFRLRTRVGNTKGIDRETTYYYTLEKKKQGPTQTISDARCSGAANLYRGHNFETWGGGGGIPERTSGAAPAGGTKA